MTGRSPFTLTAARALELSKDNTAQILRRNSLGSAMTITPEDLRELAAQEDGDLERGFSHTADALRAAADEIERLTANAHQLALEAGYRFEFQANNPNDQVKANALTDVLNFMGRKP